MPFRPPLVLDESCHTSGTLPDGRTLPLAWDLLTGKIYMKLGTSFPWNNRDNSKEATKLYNSGATMVASNDEWFRGVWAEAPQQVFDADYTRRQQLELSRGNGVRLLLNSVTGAVSRQEGGGFWPLGLTTGEAHPVSSSVIEGDFEEVEPPDEDEGEGEGEENGEAEAASKRKKKAKRARG